MLTRRKSHPGKVARQTRPAESGIACPSAFSARAAHSAEAVADSRVTAYQALRDTNAHQQESSAAEKLSSRKAQQQKSSVSPLRRSVSCTPGSVLVAGWQQVNGPGRAPRGTCGAWNGSGVIASVVAALGDMSCHVNQVESHGGVLREVSAARYAAGSRSCSSFAWAATAQLCQRGIVGRTCPVYASSGTAGSPPAASRLDRPSLRPPDGSRRPLRRHACRRPELGEGPLRARWPLLAPLTLRSLDASHRSPSPSHIASSNRGRRSGRDSHPELARALFDNWPILK